MTAQPISCIVPGHRWHLGISCTDQDLRQAPHKCSIFRAVRHQHKPHHKILMCQVQSAKCQVLQLPQVDPTGSNRYVCLLLVLSGSPDAVGICSHSVICIDNTTTVVHSETQTSILLTSALKLLLITRTRVRPTCCLLYQGTVDTIRMPLAVLFWIKTSSVSLSKLNSVMRMAKLQPGHVLS